MTQHTIAGHRVLRLLAHGERSQVWLAADDLVLKVTSPPFDAGDAGLEAQALYRARGEHVVDLFDVSLSDDEQVLIFPRLPRGSLAEVLSTRSGLDAGEAVTILVPLAGCLARMHAAGVAHGALGAAHVLFRADGAPVLVGFGSAQLFDPGLPEVTLEALPAVIADRAALTALADSVLSRVVGSRAAAASALAATLRDTGLVDLEARLEGDLFDLAAARPVVFDAPAETAVAVPGGVTRAIAVTAVPPPVAARSATRISWLLESGPAQVARAWARPRWQALSSGRRRAVLGGGAGVLVLLVTLPAWPSAPVAPAAGVGSPAPVETAVSASTAVQDDDPLTALPLLLGRRVDCLRDLSLLCLDDVDEQGSAALDDDRAALNAVLESGASPPAVSAIGATVLERWGASVLIGLGPDSDPASVLLVKGEAGWRIRDYVSR